MNENKALTGEQIYQVYLKKKREERDKADPINPPHYKSGGLEAIEVIEAFDLGYYLGNAFKYMARAGRKDPEKEVEDIKKAIWYLERKIRRMEDGPRILSGPTGDGTTGKERWDERFNSVDSNDL